MTDAMLSRALERCLTAVRRGMDLESALRSYAPLRPELDSLVLTALQLQPDAGVRLAAAPRSALRNQVMAVARSEPRVERQRALAVPFVIPLRFNFKLVAAPVFAALLVAAVLFGLGMTRSEPSSAAQTVLTVLEGEVQVQTARGLLPAINGMKLKQGESVVTGPNARAALTFSDGSTVVLAADAVVVLQEVKADSEGRLHVSLSQPQGSTWTHIPQTIGQADVRIQTPNARVETTQASVETTVSSSGGTTVGAQSGPVSVQGTTGSAAVVPSGSSASVTSPGAVSSPAPAAKPTRELQLRIEGKVYAIVTDPRQATLGTTAPGVPVNQIAGAWSEQSGAATVLHIPNAVDGAYKLTLTASGETNAAVAAIIQNGTSDRFDQALALKGGESASLSFNLVSTDLTLIGVSRQAELLPAAVVVPERAVEKANAVAVATSTATATPVKTPTQPAPTNTPLPSATPTRTATPPPPAPTSTPAKQVTPSVAPIDRQQTSNTMSTGADAR